MLVAHVMNSLFSPFDCLILFHETSSFFVIQIEHCTRRYAWNSIHFYFQIMNLIKISATNHEYKQRGYKNVEILFYLRVKLNDNWTKWFVSITPLGWGDFKFENWNLEKYATIITILVYSNEIQICGPIS